MSLIKITLVFLTGVFVGQEYGTTLPNVKSYTLSAFNEIKKTDFYKKVNSDWAKKN